MEFDITLYGKNEFYPKLNNKTYYILKVDNERKEEYMIKYFNNYIKNVKNNKENYIGIDFEFKQVRKNERDVALMQLNMENDSNEGYIFICYPPEMKDKNLKILIELITNVNITKILHGSESLDIPYLYNQLLKTEDNINNFNKNFYDTKFLCDTVHIKEKIEGKCSIYNLLLEHNIMTKDKFEELENIENITGPIYMIKIDIHNLDPNILKYSLYDVIYLPELIKKFIKKGYIYTDLIPCIISLVFKYKRNIEKEFLELQDIINKLNISYVFINDNRYFLKDIWEMYYYTIDDNNKYIEIIREINYFKQMIEIITKFVVYYNILKNYKVINKNLNNIDLYKYFVWLKKYEEFNNIIIEFNDNIIKELK